MFAGRYFPARQFAPRYFPKVGESVVIVYATLHAKQRDYTLTAPTRDYTLTAPARDFTLTAEDR